jgi:hypothetical protein
VDQGHGRQHEERREAPKKRSVHEHSLSSSRLHTNPPR